LNAAAPRSSLGIVLAVTLALAPAVGGASGERTAPGPVASAPAATPDGSPAAPQKPAAEPEDRGERARRIGIDLSSDAPFKLGADSMEIVPDERKVSDTVLLRGNVGSMEGRKLRFNQCTGQVEALCGVRLEIAPRVKAPDAVPAAPAEGRP
jgi:hypothetical protein